mmetsp:Transcript_58494/g.136687  ORF Transcript_58494/g.136687 Transcript_58494/m.136687 type:complete len:629 (+) Transcript_58494:116-2002(+)
MCTFDKQLFEVLAIASDAAKNEFGMKETLFGLLSCPDVGSTFRLATSDDIVKKVVEDLKLELFDAEPALTISNLNQDLRGILERMQEERLRLGHDCATPAHLILAITSDKQRSGPAWRRLQKYFGAQLDAHALRHHALMNLGGFQAEAEGRAEATLAGLLKEEARVQLELPVDLNGALSVLTAGLMERDVEAKLLLLAALSGEHLFLLGAPGTAKSLLARRLSDLCAGNFFERLLTRFSVPEELFGPLSLQALEKDELKRKTEGFLPNADVAFVDEIFKANSSILNTLLVILNERYFDNGPAREQVPLWCVVAASNELPDTDELDALYDRFLLRRCVSRVSSGSVKEFLKLVLDLPEPSKDAAGTSSAAHPQSDKDAAAHGEEMTKEAEEGAKVTMPLLSKKTSDELQILAKEVVIPEKILNVIAALREHCANEMSLYISDRRLVKAAQLLRVAAAAVGSREVIEADLWLLQHVFWDKNADHANAIKLWLGDCFLDETRQGIKSWDFLLTAIQDRLVGATSEGIDAALKRDLRGFIAATEAAIVAQTQLQRGTPQSGQIESGRFFWMAEDDIGDFVQMRRLTLKYTHELTERYIRANVMLEIAEVPSPEARKTHMELLLGKEVENAVF